MSWSVAIVGSPDRVVEALKGHSETLKTQCKVEFDDALPHLIGLVQQAFNRTPEAKPVGVKLSASGSGYGVGADQRDRSITVSLETLYGFVGA